MYNTDDVETSYCKKQLEDEIAARFAAAERQAADIEEGIYLPREYYTVVPWWANGR